MKQITKIIVFVLLSTLVTGCRPKYVKKNGKVYHHDWNSNGSYSKVESEVVGADPKSFKELKLPSFWATKQYAVDKNHAYWCHLSIAEADVKTFSPIDEYYSVDDKHIFRADSLFSTADPQTFRVLADEYALDSDSVYFQGKVLSGADSKTFITLGHYYAKDKNAVYTSDRILGEVSDPETFRLLGKPDKKIKSWWDFFWKMHESYDDSYLWACDKDYYYRKGKRIEGADYATFTFFDDDGCSNYAKDKYHIFYCEEFGNTRPFVVEGADVETFEILNPHRDFAKDRHRYYEEGEAISYDEAVRRKLIGTTHTRKSLSIIYQIPK